MHFGVKCWADSELKLIGTKQNFMNYVIINNNHSARQILSFYPKIKHFTQLKMQNITHHAREA